MKSERDIRPSMVTHTQNLWSAFNHPKCTHTQQWIHSLTAVNTLTHSEHTHTAVNTLTHSSEHTQQWTLTHSSEHTQQWTHTHTVNTHTQQWTHTHSSEHMLGAVGSRIAVAPGEQLGVRCLTQGSHLSRVIEGGESAVHSLPPPTIPAGPETRTHNLWITSLTL